QLSAQKQQSNATLQETERALEILDETDEDTTVYKSVGEVMVKADRDETLEDLEEEKETLEVRVDSLESREEKTQEQFDDLREEVQELLGGLGGGGLGGAMGGGA
ncbi:MAG: prefoldin subunit beta, partial [Halobacteria archaeon]|nr:prefoldin subunit beta [Halobacteria archaeon]